LLAPRFLSPMHDSFRIAGSANLDLCSPAFHAEVSVLDRRKAYLVYCLAGIGSRNAADMMEELGFGDVVNVVCGIRRWRRERLSTFCR